ncbi:MAG: helix-turn-helix domain-containing protein, partial [Treponema sp.]|nr:helix-turn-helix domain-containing protein [Treponema sp.]
TTQDWVAKKAGISFNTLQGWISKEIFPRVNEAVRIAAVLNTSVEYLVTGAVQDNKAALDRICQQLPQIRSHLEIIEAAVRELR